MNHKDHVHLLREGVPGPGGIWADLGSGLGAFTLALADLIGETGRIYSIDKDSRVLKEQEQLGITMRQAIYSATELDQLRRWVSSALKSTTIKEFRLDCGI